MSDKPSPESVREAMEKFAEEMQKSGEYLPIINTPQAQADAVLLALWEHYRSPIKRLINGRMDLEDALACADVLYGKASDE